MFSKDDILARLQDGDSADDIATEMSNALNAAQKEFDEANAREIEEKAKKDAEMRAKRAAMNEVIDAIICYCYEAGYGDIAEEVKNDEDAIDEYIKSFDGIMELARTFGKLDTLEFMKPKVEKKDCGSPSCKCKDEPKMSIKVKNVDPGEILRDFFKGV